MSPTSKGRQLQLMLVGAFCAVVILLYLTVGRTVELAMRPAAGPIPLHPYFIAGGFALACGWYCRAKLLPPPPLGAPPDYGPPAMFQTRVLLALSLAEIVALVGIFIAVPAGVPAWPFVILSLFLMGAVVTSKVLAYWNWVRTRD